MPLTITTTHHPARRLGCPPHEHPDRVQTFDVACGAAHVFYAQAGEQQSRCAAVPLHIDPVGLVRRRREPVDPRL